MHALWKPLVLVVAAICWNKSMTSPNPPPSKEDQIYQDRFFERFHTIAAFINKCYTIIVILAEAVIYFAVAHPRVLPEPIMSVLLPLGQPQDILSTISFPFVAGFTLLVLGTAVRVWCYQTLGRHFTFQVTLLPDHRLVTDGPYAYVRHPSYLACIPVFVGAGLMIFSPYAWLRGRAFLPTFPGAAIEFWLCMAVWVASSLLRRMGVEDRNLKSRFGKEWESYAKDVPCKLIPGVY